MKKAKEKQRKRGRGRPSMTVRIYYGVDAAGDHLYWTVPVRDAQFEVSIDGSLADAMAGKPGTTIGCHLSITAMRNADAFAHPVKLASFTKTAAVIISRIDKGKPSEAVRYKHSYGRLVDLNDKDASKTYIKMHPGLAERSFVLRPPTKGKSKPGTHNHGDRKPRHQRQFLVPYGAMKRAQDAGLITADLSPFVHEAA